MKATPTTITATRPTRQGRRSFGGFLIVDGTMRPLSPQVMAALKRWRPESRSMRGRPDKAS